jgi:hypothetical protein
MADLETMDLEIEQLATEIGLSVTRLRHLLQTDERYIGQLVSLGRSREFAERASFIGDLRNVLGLMASHNFSAHTAARMIGQTPENPVEISTTEEEEEDEEQQQPQQHEASSSQDEASVYPGSSESSCGESLSVSSSEDEPTIEAKRLKLDPSDWPSDTSNETTSATTTANNSRLPSEEETEEEETTESEEETFVPNNTTEEEIEVAERRKRTGDYNTCLCPILVFTRHSIHVSI